MCGRVCNPQYRLGGIEHPMGGPVMDTTETIKDPLPGPFAGQSMNCRACHLVDEHVDTEGGGMRTYTDFTRRRPVPDRPDRIEDDKVTAPRTSPPRNPFGRCHKPVPR